MPVTIPANVFINSPNLTIYHKINSEIHNELLHNEEYMTNGIQFTTDQFHDLSEESDKVELNFLQNNIITVKSHLPNIGYYDIELEASKVTSINESNNFYNWYDNDGNLKGLVIADNVSIRKDLKVRGDITAYANNIFSDIRLNTLYLLLSL